MTTTQSPSFFKSNFYKVRVCDLAQAASCIKRSKIQYRKLTAPYVSGAMKMGTKMHSVLNFPRRSFDVQVLRDRLSRRYGKGRFKRVFTRRIKCDGKIIEVRGIPDDYRVLLNWERGVQKKSTVSIIETKSTRKKRLWTNEIAVAVFQLQIYVWMMSPKLEDWYYINPRHWMEVYKQPKSRYYVVDRRQLIQKVVVYPDPNIEKRILSVINQWCGLHPMRVPRPWVCKRCPKNVKSNCDWFNRRLIKRR